MSTGNLFAENSIENPEEDIRDLKKDLVMRSDRIYHQK